MEEAENNEIVAALANQHLSNLNLNGVINAAKWFCVEGAKDRVSNMDEEEKQKFLDEIKEAQEKAQEQQVDEEEIQAQEESLTL